MFTQVIKTIYEIVHIKNHMLMYLFYDVCIIKALKLCVMAAFLFLKEITLAKTLAHKFELLINIYRPVVRGVNVKCLLFLPDFSLLMIFD